MFEKEAEEIANKRCHEIMCYGHCSFSSPKHHRCGEWHREYNCAKEGIEFGYNLAKEEIDYLNKHWGSEEERKANEWHYVKDGDLPKDEKLCLIWCGEKDFNTAEYVRERFWDLCGGWLEVDEVIAWKEIVLPELKESK